MDVFQASYVEVEHRRSTPCDNIRQCPLRAVWMSIGIVRGNGYSLRVEERSASCHMHIAKSGPLRTVTDKGVRGVTETRRSAEVAQLVTPTEVKFVWEVLQAETRCHHVHMRIVSSPVKDP